MAQPLTEQQLLRMVEQLHEYALYICPSCAPHLVLRTTDPDPSWRLDVLHTAGCTDLAEQLALPSHRSERTTPGGR